MNFNYIFLISRPIFTSLLFYKQNFNIILIRNEINTSIQLISLHFWSRTWFLFLGKIRDYARQIADAASKAKAAGGSTLDQVESAAGSLKDKVNEAILFFTIGILEQVKQKAEDLKTAISSATTSQTKVKEELKRLAESAKELGAALRLSRYLAGGDSVVEPAADKLAGNDSIKTAAYNKASQIQITGGNSGGGVGLQHAASPFLFFPTGSFMKDFMYPGILPFAFLDPQRSSLINYSMPVFYMTGPVFVLLVNDVFTSSGIIAAGGGEMDSKFKDWSKGGAHGYHAFWLRFISKNFLKQHYYNAPNVVINKHQNC